MKRETMIAVGVGGAVLAGGVLLASRRSGGSSVWGSSAFADWASMWPDMAPEPEKPPKTIDVTPDVQGLRDVDDLITRMAPLGAPMELRPLVLAQANSESGGNPLVGLGVPDPSRWPPWARPNLKASENMQRAETRAAERGYARNQEWADESPAPAGHWQFGSGGLFGFLPTTALYPLRRTDMLRSGEVDPWSVFDPWIGLALYFDYLRRIMRLPHWSRLPAEHRNAYALKRAGASLALMSDYQQAKDRSKRSARNLEKGLSRVGVPTSWASQPLTGVDWSGWDLEAVIRANPL